MQKPFKFSKRNQNRESEFKQAARRWIKLAYGQHAFCLPIAGGPYQRAGSPDDVWSIRGLAVFIEWKAPGGRVGPRQAEVISEIRAAGGRAGVVSSWEELKALLEGIETVQKGMEL
jgi:hypothetical protein